MATVHSLICWGGLTGKTVSISASTDVVTLTNHGLRDGSKLWPSGTLPDELNVLTPVYARSTATNTFTLHTSSENAIANTGNILFTGSSTYAEVTLKSDIVASPATALAAHGLSDLSRWGGTRIYDGRFAWNAARSGASPLDVEIAEIGEAFFDLYSPSFLLNIPAAAVEMTSLVNGVRSAGWHGGILGAGYVAQCPNGGYIAINVQKQNAVLDGFSIQPLSTSGTGSGLYVSSGGGNLIKNLFIYGLNTTYGRGIQLDGAMTKIINCHISNLLIGLGLSTNTPGAIIANNTIVNTANGIYGNANVPKGNWINNVVFGNAINWPTSSTSGIEFATNNTGEVGDTTAPWAIGAGASSLNLTSADFNNYAGGDFTPSATSQLIDSATEYYLAPETDISDSEVPNYNNGGAEARDIGCFEFDHGYGNHPATHTLTLDNVVVGSRVFIRDQSDTTTHYDAIAADSSVVIPITLFGDSRDAWVIKIRKASAAPYYKPYRTQMTATAGASSIYVDQIPN